MRFILVELSPSGGLFQFSHQLGTSLARLGHKVELVTGRRPELQSQEPGFTVSAILPTWHPGAAAVETVLRRRARRPVRALLHFAALAQLVRHVHRRRAEVVVWHGTRFPIDAWALLLARRLNRSAIYCTVMHETRPLAEQRRKGSLFRSNPVLLRSISQTLQTLDLVFVLGEGARRDVVERWAPRASVEIIPHGDEGIFLPEGEIPVVATTGQNVLFFGTWIRHKGIDVLLDAFELLRSSVPDATLTVAGAVGGDVDLEAIRARASQVGNVVLRPGYVSLNDVPAFFGSARVVAVPYLRANQSGVVHLAQTFGRPVVATAVGDIPAAVRDGVDGYVIPPGDVPALAGSLRTLLLDPAEADRLGRQGRQRVLSEGSWDDIANKVTAAVERVGERSSRSDGHRSAAP